MKGIGINTLLGVGGLVSMIASPILAFSGVNSTIAVQQTKIESLERNYTQVQIQLQAQNNLLIRIAAKLNVETGGLGIKPS